jgi:hypothetical protein
VLLADVLVVELVIEVPLVALPLPLPLPVTLLPLLLLSPSAPPPSVAPVASPKRSWALVEHAPMATRVSAIAAPTTETRVGAKDPGR